MHPRRKGRPCRPAVGPDSTAVRPGSGVCSRSGPARPDRTDPPARSRGFRVFRGPIDRTGRSRDRAGRGSQPGGRGSAGEIGPVPSPVPTAPGPDTRRPAGSGPQAPRPVPDDPIRREPRWSDGSSLVEFHTSAGNGGPAYGTRGHAARMRFIACGRSARIRRMALMPGRAMAGRSSSTMLGPPCQPSRWCP
jgi:hypothetical protein